MALSNQTPKPVIASEPPRKAPKSSPSIGFWLVAFVCLAFGYQLFFGPKPMKSGGVAPTLQLEQLDDAKRWQPTWKQKVTVLEFWATHCSVCVRKLKASSRRAARNRKAGTQHLMINIDSPTSVQSLRRYLKQQGIPKSQWHVHQRDARYQSSRRFNITALPTIVLINRKGKVAQYFRGTVSDSYLNAYIKRIASD